MKKKRVDHLNMNKGWMAGKWLGEKGEGREERKGNDIKRGEMVLLYEE